jgi:vancomycin permeability regulator SanA
MNCPRRPPRRLLRTLCLAILVLVAVPLSGVLLIEARMDAATRGNIYHDVSMAPHRRIAIVFGAQVLPGGRLSVALAHRVDAAVALYQAGKVDKLLLTGDNSSPGYDEPDAMRDYAVARGVPPGAIVLDYAGLRTYDSCYRASKVFGVRSDEAILVTQDYHLPRAMYTCDELGVRAIGFAAAPFFGPGADSAVEREHPARWLAWWQATITRPLPRFPQ